MRKPSADWHTTKLATPGSKLLLLSSPCPARLSSCAAAWDARSRTVQRSVRRPARWVTVLAYDRLPLLTPSAACTDCHCGPQQVGPGLAVRPGPARQLRCAQAPCGWHCGILWRQIHAHAEANVARFVDLTRVQEPACQAVLARCGCARAALDAAAELDCPHLASQAPGQCCLPQGRSGTQAACVCLLGVGLPAAPLPIPAFGGQGVFLVTRFGCAELALTSASLQLYSAWPVGGIPVAEGEHWLHHLQLVA